MHGRNTVFGISLDAGEQVDGAETRAVNDETRFELRRRTAAGLDEKTFFYPQQALDAAIAYQHTARVFHVALQCEHVGMLIDDAARRAEQRGGTADFRFELVCLGARDEADAVDVVGIRALEQM